MIPGKIGRIARAADAVLPQGEPVPASALSRLQFQSPIKPGERVPMTPPEDLPEIAPAGMGMEGFQPTPAAPRPQPAPKPGRMPMPTPESLPDIAPAGTGIKDFKSIPPVEGKLPSGRSTKATQGQQSVPVEPVTKAQAFGQAIVDAQPPAGPGGSPVPANAQT